MVVCRVQETDRNGHPSLVCHGHWDHSDRIPATLNVSGNLLEHLPEDLDEYFFAAWKFRDLPGKWAPGLAPMFSVKEEGSQTLTYLPAPHHSTLFRFESSMARIGSEELNKAICLLNRYLS